MQAAQQANAGTHRSDCFTTTSVVTATIPLTEIYGISPHVKVPYEYACLAEGLQHPVVTNRQTGWYSSSGRLRQVLSVSEQPCIKDLLHTGSLQELMPLETADSPS